MTEPNPLAKAEAAVTEAADNTDVVRIVAAVLAAQQLAQQQAPAPACQHQHGKPFDTKKWVVIGGTACVCSLAFALASIAIAIGATCATACLLVLRSLWREYQKGR